MQASNGTNGGRAPPFGQWERSVAARYLRAKRSQGGVALISIISFIGIMLAVAVLIIVMSVMNGFRAELLSRMLGFSGHLYVAGGVLVSP
ncbi:MAG TPA: lipoprotein-releasing system transmembrane subunit LolC, partial [Phenylobacterium sp.]|nr:lipoprotein-releasing system transmembrane subunit LolC [Phenylobacterium sp.]